MARCLWIAGWLISRLSQGEPWQLLLVAPAAWVLVEWMRGWIFTGFPVAGARLRPDRLATRGLGAGTWRLWRVLHAAGQSPPPIIVDGHAAPADPARCRVSLPFCCPGWSVASWLSDWTEPAGEPMRASIVQAGVSQDKKWDRDQLTADHGVLSSDHAECRRQRNRCVAGSRDPRAARSGGELTSTRVETDASRQRADACCSAFWSAVSSVALTVKSTTASLLVRRG